MYSTLMIKSFFTDVSKSEIRVIVSLKYPTSLFIKGFASNVNLCFATLIREKLLRESSIVKPPKSSVLSV